MNRIRGESTVGTAKGKEPEFFGFDESEEEIPEPANIGDTAVHPEVVQAALPEDDTSEGGLSGRQFYQDLVDAPGGAVQKFYDEDGNEVSPKLEARLWEHMGERIPGVPDILPLSERPVRPGAGRGGAPGPEAAGGTDVIANDEDLHRALFGDNPELMEESELDAPASGRHGIERPYGPGELEDAKANLLHTLERVSAAHPDMVTSEQQTEWQRRITEAQNPQDIVGLVRQMRSTRSAAEDIESRDLGDISREGLARRGVQTDEAPTPEPPSPPGGRPPEAAPPPPSGPLGGDAPTLNAETIRRPVIPGGLKAEVPSFMGGLDALQRRAEPITRSEVPPLGVIFSDPVKQMNFYKLVDLKGQRHLVERYARMAAGDHSGEAMRPGDIETLDKLRVEFDRRSKFSEELRSNLKEADMLQILQTEPSLKFLIAGVGPERATELINQHMESVVMQLEDKDLDTAVNAQRALIYIRKQPEYLEIRDHIREKMKNENLEVENIKWHELNPTLEKDFLKGSWFQRIKNPRQTVAAINTDINIIGKILGATISFDHKLQSDVAQEALGDPRVTGPTIDSPNNAQEYQTEREKLTLKSLEETKLPEFKRNYFATYGRNWNEDSPEVRKKNFFDKSIIEPETKNRAHRGWFGAMLAAFMKLMLDKAWKDERLDSRFREN